MFSWQDGRQRQTAAEKKGRYFLCTLVHLQMCTFVHEILLFTLKGPRLEGCHQL